jgi:hypothetical protein
LTEDQKLEEFQGKGWDIVLFTEQGGVLRRLIGFPREVLLHTSDEAGHHFIFPDHSEYSIR